MQLSLGATSPEVIKWQKFLGLPQSGIFDESVKLATAHWQSSHGLKPDGVVGKQTSKAALAFGYRPSIDQAVSSYYPPRPNFSTPDEATRRNLFGSFDYKKRNSSDITILGDWVAKNIVTVHIPQLKDVEAAPKNCMIQFHRKGAEQIKAFFEEIEKEGQLHLVLTWAGSFYPRFIRGSSHTLSNHSWGTAFDINAAWNWLNQKPAPVGTKGTILELVPIANKLGFFWGGHYNNRLDGMHFELAKIVQVSVPTPPPPPVDDRPEPHGPSADDVADLTPQEPDAPGDTQDDTFVPPIDDQIDQVEEPHPPPSSLVPVTTPVVEVETVAPAGPSPEQTASSDHTPDFFDRINTRFVALQGGIGSVVTGVVTWLASNSLYLTIAFLGAGGAIAVTVVLTTAWRNERKDKRAQELALAKMESDRLERQDREARAHEIQIKLMDSASRDDLKTIRLVPPPPATQLPSGDQG